MAPWCYFKDFFSINFYTHSLNQKFLKDTNMQVYEEIHIFYDNICTQLS